MIGPLPARASMLARASSSSARVRRASTSSTVRAISRRHRPHHLGGGHRQPFVDALAERAPFLGEGAHRRRLGAVHVQRIRGIHVLQPAMDAQALGGAGALHEAGTIAAWSTTSLAIRR